jgi:c(7)-type cytochrome triheme protein
VRGKVSTYEEVDTRVYIEEPIFSGLKEDGIHDVNNDAINRLQQPRAAMRNFPFDRRGGINWVQAIDKGIINPRMSLKGKGDTEMNIMDMDIIFKDTGQMPWVRFPHLAHTRWLDCSNCHPAIFVPQKGGNPNIGMDAIIGGKYCGRCHDKVAFALWTCERCHSVPHEGSPAAWWRKSDNPFPATNTSKQGDSTDEEF